MRKRGIRMQIIKLGIQNFKSILQMQISDIENALILVGKNNTGKTAVLDAIRAVSGQYKIQDEDFQEDYPNIEIEVSLKLNDDDLYCHARRMGLSVSIADMNHGTKTFARSCRLTKRGFLILHLWQIGKERFAIAMDIKKIIVTFHRFCRMFIISMHREAWTIFRKIF